MKRTGKPYAGNPHVRFDVAGDGNFQHGEAIEALPKETGRNG